MRTGSPSPDTSKPTSEQEHLTVFRLGSSYSTFRSEHFITESDYMREKKTRSCSKQVEGERLVAWATWDCRLSHSEQAERESDAHCQINFQTGQRHTFQISGTFTNTRFPSIAEVTVGRLGRDLLKVTEFWVVREIANLGWKLASNWTSFRDF